MHPPRRVAVPVLVKDGKPYMGPGPPTAYSSPGGPYNVNPFSYNGIPTAGNAYHSQGHQAGHHMGQTGQLSQQGYMGQLHGRTW